MKKRTLIFSAAAIVIVLAVVPFALAQHLRGAGHRHTCMAGGGNGMMMFGHMQRARTALGLSDQQDADIKKIFADLRTQNAPYRASLRDGMQSVAEALLANPNDVSAAQSLLDKQNEAERQMKTNALNAAAKALNVLSADQRAKAATFLRQRMAKQAEK